MSEDVSARIKTINETINAAAQDLADTTDQHVELAMALLGVVYYKFYHPASCPERVKQLPAHDDVPDVFKQLWEDGGTAEEPKPEGGE